MEDLLEQLLQRWESAFDELEMLKHYKASVKKFQYSSGYRYQLDKFDRTSFPSGGPMAESKDNIDPIGLYQYGFNADGFPCYVTFRHDHNKIDWEGLYRYSDMLAEYVEFCLNTGIPSTIQRIKYEEGRKVSFESIIINGGGNIYAGQSKKDIISKIRNDGFSFFATVTTYHYGATGKIEQSKSFHNSPGIGKYTSYDEYTYDESQELDTIRTHFEGGTNRLAYCRIPENMDPQSLIASVAAALAKSIAETLAKQDPELPIALLELNYHYADNYIPLLNWRTSHDIAAQLANKEFDFPNGSNNFLPVEVLPFEKLFAQLEQMMNEKNDMNLGRSMVRKAAFLLTSNKLYGKLKVSDDFAAYAVDWSIEGHSDEDFKEILLECGVQPGTLESWKKKGMFPHSATDH